MSDIIYVWMLVTQMTRQNQDEGDADVQTGADRYVCLVSHLLYHVGKKMPPFCWENIRTTKFARSHGKYYFKFHNKKACKAHVIIIRLEYTINIRPCPSNKDTNLNVITPPHIVSKMIFFIF